MPRDFRLFSRTDNDLPWSEPTRYDAIPARGRNNKLRV